MVIKLLTISHEIHFTLILGGLRSIIDARHPLRRALRLITVERAALFLPRISSFQRVPQRPNVDDLAQMS